MFNYVKAYLGNIINNEKGQGLVEYALIIALVSVLLVASLIAFKGQIAQVFTNIQNSLGRTS